MGSFANKLDIILDSLNSSKAKVVKKNTLKVEVPHMIPRNQPGEVSRPVSPVVEDIDELVDKEFGDLDGTENLDRNKQDLPDEVDEVEENVDPDAIPDPVPPLDGVDEQTVNEPKDEIDQQSESLTVSAGIVNKIEDVLGHGTESDWVKKGNEIGLDDPNIRLITMQGMTLPEAWKAAGVSLSNAKELVIKINQMINDHLSSGEGGETVPPPAIDGGSAPSKNDDVQQVADEMSDIPAAPELNLG